MAKALWLERHATKEEILEIYLTNAPYGGNICGIEAAARRYFGKSARDLTASEAALPAGIPKPRTATAPTENPQAAWRRMHRKARMRETGPAGRVSATESTTPHSKKRIVPGGKCPSLL